MIEVALDFIMRFCVVFDLIMIVNFIVLHITGDTSFLYEDISYD